jgi:FtsP/CotA-like multicopper oxidase with cupredoxin domain
MYRRQFLKSSAALAGSLVASPLLATGASAGGAARALTITTRSLDIDGKAATVYGLADQIGRRGLTFDPGETFSLALHNRLADSTIVHWHGLVPPFEQDGVADNPLPMLKAGETRRYDFPLDRSGTHWMHAHTLQHQNLLSAPLIVRSAEDLKADMQEVVILLHDFSFTPAEELLANLTGGNAGGHHSMDHGSMDMGGMDHGSMDMGGMDMAAMDLNDINYDAYLANDRTLDDPEVISVEKGGRVRLRIINGAASTAFSISTGPLQADLVAVDGQPVAPLRDTVFPMTMGQRIDLVVSIPVEGGAFPIVALREGAAERTGVVLATSGADIRKIATAGEAKGPVLGLGLEQRLAAVSPLSARPADREFMVHLTGDMSTYRWGMMGAEDMAAKPGERIEIAIMNMSMMAHPMHLHGHHFQVVGIDGRRFSGALRDTVLVPPMKTVTIALDAGATGNWPFHCHHLYHMESGMMAYLPIG